MKALVLYEFWKNLYLISAVIIIKRVATPGLKNASHQADQKPYLQSLCEIELKRTQEKHIVLYIKVKFKI